MVQVRIKFATDKMANAFQIWFCEKNGYAAYASYAAKMKISVADDVEGEFDESEDGSAQHEITVSASNASNDDDDYDDDDDDE